MSRVGIFAGDIGGEAVFGVVRDLDRLVDRVIGEDRQNRPENLFARDRHVIGDIREDGGLGVIAPLQALGLSEAARDEARLLLDSFLDEGLNLVPLRLGDERAHERTAGGIADCRRFGGRPGESDDLFHALARGDHARGGVAGLAGVAHDRADARRHRCLHVGVFEQNVGALPAELLTDALDGGRGVPRNLDAGARRAREGDHVDAGMRADRRSDRRTVSIDQIENARRHARRIESFRKDYGREGRDLGRFQNHRAAGGQRRRDLAGDLVERPVPGRDETAYADRLLDDQRRAAKLFEGVAFQHLGGGSEMRRAHGGLGALGEPDGRAHLLGDGLGHILMTFFEFCDDPLEQFETLLASRARKAFEGCDRRLHRTVDIRGGAQRDAAANPLRRGIDHRERLRLDRGDPASVDVEFQIVAHRDPPILRLSKRLVRVLAQARP